MLYSHIERLQETKSGKSRRSGHNLGICSWALQQTVKIELRSIEVDDGKASLGIPHTYISSAFLGIAAFSTALEVHPDFIAEHAISGTGMQGAIHRGLFRLDPRILFNCPSNCTWADTDCYPSLGLSSSCADVTQAPSRFVTRFPLTTSGTVRQDHTQDTQHAKDPPSAYQYSRSTSGDHILQAEVSED
ncbi:hypothetical protein QBC44DRAFT_364038 [Cladorrhinum sp. PSN332]|nr:hypothetical protein QBC44DRAFT_364038 [Cladorrhinum sp. PSN332]